MITKKRTAAVLLALSLATMVISASAFTTATVERDSNIEVVSDGDGILQLGAGDTDGVYEKSNGELSIEMDSATASGINGVNPSAKFAFGDSATINSSNSESTYVYAFNVTVVDAMTGNGQMTMSYSDTDTNSDENVKFEVYEATSTGPNLVATATEEAAGSFSPTKDTTYYVVLTIDTGGGAAADLASGTSLDGTLTISVN